VRQVGWQKDKGEGAGRKVRRKARRTVYGMAKHKKAKGSSFIML